MIDAAVSLVIVGAAFAVALIVIGLRTRTGRRP